MTAQDEAALALAAFKATIETTYPQTLLTVFRAAVEECLKRNLVPSGLAEYVLEIERAWKERQELRVEGRESQL